MKQDEVTIKVTKNGRDMLRLVSAITGEKHYEVVDRLLEAEKKRLTDKQ